MCPLHTGSAASFTLPFFVNQPCLRGRKPRGRTGGEGRCMTDIREMNDMLLSDKIRR
jgi:hypothetical protein